MKGQQQLVSVIIIVGIIVGTTATVLPWANTMIDKNKDMKNVDDVQSFFETLDETITYIAKNGGEESLNLDVDGKFTVYPDGSGNNITFVFYNKVSNVAEGGSIPLNTANMDEVGVLGLDPTGVIFAKATDNADEIELEYCLWYRTLEDPLSEHNYTISLNTSDGETKDSSSGFIRVQYDGIDKTSDLTTTKIKIII